MTKKPFIAVFFLTLLAMLVSGVFTSTILAKEQERQQSVFYSNPGLPIVAGPADDIRLEDFADFTDWRQVTVTFRNDNNELRFAYANDIAYKALQAGRGEYPDGAVFAKVASITGSDPAFFNSKIPTYSNRYQLMVRDKKKYAAYGGWGYALFDSTGAKQQIKQADCDACHKLVKDRNYVFSRIKSIKVPDQSMIAVMPKETGIESVRITFIDYPVSKLPDSISQYLPRGVEKIRMLDGYLRDHFFIGTAYELAPQIGKQALTSGRPTLYMDNHGKAFLMLYAVDPAGEKIAPKCSTGEKLLVSYLSLTTTLGSQPGKNLYCVNNVKVQ